MDWKDAFSKLARLPNLKSLDLRDNQISLVPEEIAGLKSLEELDLSANPLSQDEQNKIQKLLPSCKISF